MTAGLRGAQILVTRPARQAGHLCSMIEAEGGQALRLPTLEIVAATPPQPALTTAMAADWLIFTSTNAVDFAIRAFDGKMPGISLPRIAAVGAATAHSLQQAGWRIDCAPVENFSSEGLLAEPQLQQLAGKTCVIVRGIGGREKLATELQSRGAVVSYLEVYSRRCPQTDIAPLANSLAALQLQAVTVTSVEALQNLLALIDQKMLGQLRETPLVVMSDRIGQTAKQLGFKRIIASRQPTDAAILETLTALFNGENSGRTN